MYHIIFSKKKQEKIERHKMEFIFEKAIQENQDEIWEVMKEAAQTVKKKEWFAAGDKGYIKEILEGKGFIILAREAKSKELAGFFIVVIPGEEDYMGDYAGIPKEENDKIVHLDTAAVKSDFRGNKLQRRMLEKAEEELVKIMKEKHHAIQYRLCSVHPENTFSLLNMTENGYEIKARTQLYGGLERFVLCKKTVLI